MSDEMANDAYGLFYTFNQRLKEDEATPESEWRKIKQTYLMLEEWFEDRTLYHMVGFLVSQEHPHQRYSSTIPGLHKERIRAASARRNIPPRHRPKNV